MRKSTLLLAAAGLSVAYILAKKYAHTAAPVTVSAPTSPLLPAPGTSPLPSSAPAGAPPSVNTIPGGGFWSSAISGILQLTPLAVPALIYQAVK